jgi:hypothetical protein
MHETWVTWTTQEMLHAMGFLKKFAVSLLRQDVYINISQPNSAFAGEYVMYQTSILIMKANEMDFFSHLFDKVLYMFRTSPLSIIRSISTLYTGNRYFSCQLCWRLLAWSGTILTTPTDANRTSMTNTYCVYTVLRYSCWWTADLSETCRVLYQINLRNSASGWLSL